MKENKIPFDLEKYRTGKYKVTRDKLDARIVCTDAEDINYPIVALVHYGDVESPVMFTIKGEFISGHPNNDKDLFLECKEFEEGDIVISKYFILPYRGTTLHDTILTDVCFNIGKGILQFETKVSPGYGYTEDYRLATEEEKKKFFYVLEKEGKRWNTEKKCVENIKPKCDFQPFDKVLVRDSFNDKWSINFFSYIDNKEFPFNVIDDNVYKYCIPYNDETKKLVGTTDDYTGKI